VSDLVPANEGGLIGKIVEVGGTGLTWLREPTLEQYLNLGSMFSYAADAYQWAIGDLIAYGQGKFGEEWSQIEHNLGLSETTLEVLASVARKVPPARRNPELKWSHHRAIANKVSDPVEQAEWLERAEGMSVREIRAQLETELKGKKPEKRPTLREAVRMAVDYAHPYGDSEWVLSDDVYQTLCASIGAPTRQVIEP
jgi:hypothetical protein